MASSQDAWYLSLLGLAENFRTSSPPNIKLCIQCLQAVFNFKPPPRVEARTHLQLGNILLTHTKNIDLARTHLEQAWLLSQMINTFDDVKFEAASVLAELYEQLQQSNLSKPILRKAIELSQHSVYWHCRLIFQLAQIHASERDYEVASSLLGVGVDYAHISSAAYTRVLFLLSRGMLLLIDKKFNEVNPLLNQAGHLVDQWQGSQHQKEYLKVFFLVLQVCHYLMAGQVKSVKPCLKQLQQSIQTIMQPSWPSDEVVSGPNVGDMFIWMPKEHLYVLVYLVTVMHSMQAGYMDKAQKYTDKALMQIEKLKIVDNKPILSVFQIMLLEHIAMCRLVMGNKCLALQEIAQACMLCQQQPRLLQTHSSQMHTLLGLYSMSMNCLEQAEDQFMAALKVKSGTNSSSDAATPPQTSQDRELWTFANLNLAIVYLRAKREKELTALLERINPENLPTHSHSLRAAAYYVQGLQSFFQARYNEAKRYLRETLKMANAEDLNRLTSCSLVLLGHIFLSLGNSRESMNMVTPAMQLASKIPDVHVQLWASAILRDLYRLCGDPVRENEAFQMHCNYSQMLLKDHFQSSQLPEHVLITWKEGNVPVITGNPASTSSSLLV
ncbi:MAU2 chromatid cohesion factor homolog [Schistocerca americana]|uniref:MAU2 chromatid cohesion factor homolog n=1 Tax=Schistocerca americana TaxID=7009 RepID=UPI001F4FDAF3|nr:MAU2 chromatid cohesion factor homolog [Schistocerca americana]XP_047117986.1 MAU2 chromatid cohesion factor homolog [Schistocerca piceifrons]XP_049787604.1 MAU2 chromatid cohesion factor homolog [Schistocerca cancellata]XP_049815651.1 MAU2 chromatid cohesion factor homolog [Schistocerca nitens]XP_049963507.1 MAU2 chromatid cohesion factor homolog [Schistocerca serialis cubense]